ncbi:MAG: MMPL family transporter [Acidobacteriota bacterium]
MKRSLPRTLSFWAIDHPRWVIVAFCLLLALAAPGLTRLELRLDGRALVPSDAPALLADQRIQQIFGVRDPLVVVIDTGRAGGILSADRLRAVRELNGALAGLEGLGWGALSSLVTEPRDRVDSIDASPFLSPLPESAADLTELERDIAAAAILTGTLVSVDGASTATLVKVPGGVDRQRLVTAVQNVLAEVELPAGTQAFLVGAPAAEVLLGRHVLADLQRLLPLALLLMALVLGWFFRRPWAVALAFAEVLGCLIFTFGLLGWSGQPIYLTTAILPVVLTTLALTDEIHLLAVGQRIARRRPAVAGRCLARAVVAELARPVALTSLTTALAFLSFLASDLPPVRSFGSWAAVGVLFCLLWSLTVTPVLMRLLGPRRWVAPGDGWHFAGWRLRGRWPLVAALALLVLVAGALRLEVQDGWVSGFARGSDFRRSVERFNEQFYGAHRLQLRLELPATGGEAQDAKPFWDPEVLAAVERFERGLRSLPAVGGVLGPYGHLAAVTHLARGRPAGPRAPPDDAEYIRRMWRRIELGRGPDRRREIVDDDYRQGLVTVFLGDANYRDTAAVLGRVDELAERDLKPLGGRVEIGGDVAVSQAMIAAIVGGQLKSLALAGLGILLLLTWSAGSLGRALRALLPVSLAALVSLGVMGWCGIPMGVATSMFLALSLGVGVDFSVHFMARERAHGSRQAARAAIAPAVLLDALALGLGFGLLGLSQVPANSRLGLLVALAMVTAAGVTLVGFRGEEKRRLP